MRSRLLPFTPSDQVPLVALLKAEVSSVNLSVLTFRTPVVVAAMLVLWLASGVQLGSSPASLPALSDVMAMVKGLPLVASMVSAPVMSSSFQLVPTMPVASVPRLSEPERRPPVKVWGARNARD